MEKAGFTDKAHLKAKGLIFRADGTKRKSPKYEDLDKDDVSTIKRRSSNNLKNQLKNTR